MTIKQNQELTEKAGDLATGMDELLSQIGTQITPDKASLLDEAKELLFQLRRQGVFTVLLI